MFGMWPSVRDEWGPFCERAHPHGDRLLTGVFPCSPTMSPSRLPSATRASRRTSWTPRPTPSR